MKLKFITFILLVASISTACNSTPEQYSGRVAIIMPMDDSPRWGLEAGNMTVLFRSQDYDALWAFFPGAKEQASAIRSLKNGGIKALVLASVDTESTEINAAIAELRELGVRIICYDRLQQNTEDVDLFIGVDGHTIGQLQAAALSGLGDGSKIEIIAGSTTDKNAVEFFDGAWSSISSNVTSGKWTIPSNRKTFAATTTGDWSYNSALKYTNELLATYYSDGSIPDAFIAPNDSAAQAVVDALATRSLQKYPIITGQDNSEESRYLIVQGKQTMTIDKNSNEYCSAAVKAALSETITFSDMKYNGKKNIPMVRITPKAIYKADI